MADGIRIRGGPSGRPGGSGGDAAQGTAGARALYPFLDGAAAAGSSDPRTAELRSRELRADLLRSTRMKIMEAAALRRECLLRYADRLAACAGRIAERIARGGRVLTFGNGGSSTDAAALAALFLDGGSAAGFPEAGPDARPAAARCLTDEVAVLTALANDVSFDVVFARQLATLGRAADVAVGLSTSGNSPNLIRAFEEAANRRMLTVGFAGGDGGRMASRGLVDFLFVVPSSSVHRIQEAQTTLYHVLWELTQQTPAGGPAREGSWT